MEPKLMQSRFNSKCASSGNPIKAGDNVGYFASIKRAVLVDHLEGFDPTKYKPATKKTLTKLAEKLPDGVWKVNLDGAEASIKDKKQAITAIQSFLKEVKKESGLTVIKADFSYVR